MTSPAIDARIVVFVATDAVRHISELERRCDFAHRLNLAMTLLAWDIFQDVGLMVEIDEIGEHIHLCPPNGLFFIPRFSDFLDFGARGCNKLMTADACLHRRNHSGFSSSRSAMTILTAHLVLSGMYFMTERDRLAGLLLTLLTTGKSQ